MVERELLGVVETHTTKIENGRVRVIVGRPLLVGGAVRKPARKVKLGL